MKSIARRLDFLLAAGAKMIASRVAREARRPIAVMSAAGSLCSRPPFAEVIS
ncbi:MAG TPA: hypothetical protein VHV50_11045 [Actinomycetota bacterium]|jgi:hypothetical protein|nr:hypothetical protein [Actinomycetota bacterium]